MLLMFIFGTPIWQPKNSVNIRNLQVIPFKKAGWFESVLFDESLLSFFFSGVQERDIRCVLTNDNSIVSDEACNLLAKPPSSQECNMEACAPMYVIKINLIYFLSS